MNTVQKSLYCLFSALLCTGTALAAEEAGATLMEVNGTVLVNQGKNYQAAHSGMKLAANARVFTKDKASAVVTSKQGCVTRLGANSLFVVKPADPCHGGPTAQKAGPAAYASAGATGGGAAADTGGLFGLSTNQTVLAAAGGMAVVTGGVVGGLAASGGLDPSSSDNNYAVAAASNAVIAAGGDAKAAYAAAAAAAAGGSPADIYNAVIAAGGSPSAASAAAAAFSVAANGGNLAAIQTVVAPCISPTTEKCVGPL